MTGDTCPLIVGQWGLQCAACGVCQQHEASADSGIASRIITSADATSLSRHVMFSTMILPTTSIPGCDGHHSRVGDPKSAMPPVPPDTTDQQINEVVDFLMTLKG